jgi:hypothetical protein
MDLGENNFFEALALELAGQSIYLSIDKDCLLSDAAITNWGQGQLSLSGLISGIGSLLECCKIVGADICGEASPQPLKGFAKRLDAGRLLSQEDLLHEAHVINQKTNLALLAAFSNKYSVIGFPNDYLFSAYLYSA